jgi:hypothetical protein
MHADVEIEPDERGVLLRYAPLLVRPNTRHRLPTVQLALPPALADQEIPLRWRETSASTPGETAGVTTLAVEPQGEPGCTE